MSNRLDINSIAIRVQQIESLINSEDFKRVHEKHQFSHLLQDTQAYNDLDRLEALIKECLAEVYRHFDYLVEVKAEKLVKDCHIQLCTLESNLKNLSDKLFTYKVGHSTRIYK